MKPCCLSYVKKIVQLKRVVKLIYEWLPNSCANVFFFFFLSSTFFLVRKDVSSGLSDMVETEEVSPIYHNSYNGGKEKKAGIQ